ncbi:MAG: hypothetical protein EBT06_15065, partial [Gammaproteobacteria bacterium]|nr:hypothetical protein [Gammaproteobacteria bacterium]
MHGLHLKAEWRPTVHAVVTLNSGAFRDFRKGYYLGEVARITDGEPDDKEFLCLITLWGETKSAADLVKSCWNNHLVP